MLKRATFTFLFFFLSSVNFKGCGFLKKRQFLQRRLRLHRPATRFVVAVVGTCVIYDHFPSYTLLIWTSFSSSSSVLVYYIIIRPDAAIVKWGNSMMPIDLVSNRDNFGLNLWLIIQFWLLYECDRLLTI